VRFRQEVTDQGLFDKGNAASYALTREGAKPANKDYSAAISCTLNMHHQTHILKLAFYPPPHGLCLSHIEGLDATAKLPSEHVYAAFGRNLGEVAGVDKFWGTIE
jgi:hypothetical protein